MENSPDESAGQVPAERWDWQTALNPIAIVVPCHRVIGSWPGELVTTVRIERKRWLLKHEAEHT